MCTLVAIHRRIPGAPLVIAANRDEYYERPAEGPALRHFGEAAGPEGAVEAPAPILAPLDARAGGTWFGLSSFGVFGAVTNLRSESKDPERRSRGMVVPAALREPSAARAADVLKALPEEAYNPFQCFVADRDHAFLLIYRDVPRVRELEPGVHVVGNLDPHEEPAPKVDRVRAAAATTAIAAMADADDVLEGLAAVCREHGTGGGGVGDTCVHLDSYGTRSSALLLLADERAESRLLFSAAAPCQSEYQDLSNLVFQLSSESGAGWRTAPERSAVRNAS